jgi:hypothetical protein
MVATIGLHGSASTWVFNVARELLAAARGDAGVLAVYGDRIEDLPTEADRPGRCVVLKSHHGSTELDAALAAAHARLLLSVRDPRDAAVSMARRFRSPLDQAAQWIANDCRRMAGLVAGGHMLLRYEDRFFDDPAAPARIARALGIDTSPAACAVIFARYSTEAVRRFATHLDALPPERLVSFGPTTMDKVTQIHRTHVGDALSGKWRDLPAPARNGLTRFLAPFLGPLGYAP